MSFPFSVDVALPGRAGLRQAARSRWVWSTTAGILVTLAIGVLHFRQDQAIAEAVAVQLQVRSDPAGALVEIDGQERGRSPLSLSVAPGTHNVRLSQAGFFDTTYSIHAGAPDGATLSSTLWRQTPRLLPLRPTFPGATIAGVTFLADGRLALTVALPPGNDRQLWLLDERGTLQRFGPPTAKGALTVSPDGARAAYLLPGASTGLDETRLDEVWVTGQDGQRGERRFALPGEARSERLLDLSWAPDSRHLLVAIREQLASGGARARLRWLDLGTPVDQPDAGREILSLPSDVVSGSFLWSPDGRHVAFLAQAGQLTALCLLGIEDAQFLYLADLSSDGTGRLSFPPVAWSPDGRDLLYAAPSGTSAPSSGWLFGTQPQPALFVSIMGAEGAAPGRRLGDASGNYPIWRTDNSRYTLAHYGANGPLTLRSLDPGDHTRDLGDLPLKASASYAVLWDAARAQAVVAVPGGAGSDPTHTDYWLLRFAPEASR